MKKLLFISLVCFAFCIKANAQRYTVGGFGIQAEKVFPNEYSGGFFYNLENYRRIIGDGYYINSSYMENASKVEYKDYIANIQYQWNILQAFGHLVNLNAGLGANLGFRELQAKEIEEGHKGKYKSNIIYGPVAAIELQVYLLFGLSAIAETKIKWLGHLVHASGSITHAIGLRYEFL